MYFFLYAIYFELLFSILFLPILLSHLLENFVKLITSFGYLEKQQGVFIHLPESTCEAKI